jgi:hypothetical protein
MQLKLYFTSSKEIAKRLTEVFDFAWPTAAAMWNLRWQVDGFLRANPDATDSILQQRFINGSGISGANLKRSCIQWSWEMQQQQFAKFLLIEFCALYEAWIDSVLDEIGNGIRKQFQFPTNGTDGIGNALLALQANISTELETTIYPALQTNKKYDPSHLNELLICYRYFKECRNVLVHYGGIATQRAAQSYTAYSALSAVSLGVTEMPDHCPIGGQGDSVQLRLRGVVGFGEIVLKLISTLDVELSKTTHAEAVLRDRWISVTGKKRYLPADSHDRRGAIIRLIRKLESTCSTVA